MPGDRSALDGVACFRSRVAVGGRAGRRGLVEEGSLAVVDLDDGWPARSQVGSEARGRITYGPCG